MRFLSSTFLCLKCCPFVTFSRHPFSVNRPENLLSLSALIYADFEEGVRAEKKGYCLVKLSKDLKWHFRPVSKKNLGEFRKLIVPAYKK